MIELVLFPLGLFVGGGILGYWLCSHIHSVANAANRATTLSSGDVEKLNNAVSGLGDILQKLIHAASSPVVNALDKAA